MTYTTHALERMAQRSVTKAEVIEALNSTVRVVRDSERGRKVYYGLTKAGRGIRLVLVLESDVVVITVTPRPQAEWPKGGKL